MGPGTVLARPMRLGTRGSALALAQTALVVAALDRLSPAPVTEIVVVRTEGDSDKSSPLSEIGGRGVFTTALEAALLHGEIDAAVHSAKDLPTAIARSAPIIAVPDRDDPRDVLVSRHHMTLDQLPSRPVIGTSSRRRASQILRLRPDARIVNLRGNIDTRLRKAQNGDYDAIVLAAAGMRRLGWGDQICQIFSIDELVPSPGQGAIAVQAIAGSDIADTLSATDNRTVSKAVAIERAFLASTGVGCSSPVGAHATVVGGQYRLVAMLADPSGHHVCQAEEDLAAGEEEHHAAEIGRRLRSQVDGGVQCGWNGFRTEAGALAGARVVVTRPRRQAEPLLKALAARGAEAMHLPTIRVEPVEDMKALDAALRAAARGEFDWIVFSSVNGVETVGHRLSHLQLAGDDCTGARVAAIGRATADCARKLGFTVALIPSKPDGETLALELSALLAPDSRVLYPRSAIGRDDIPDALRDRGADVVCLDVYRTLPESTVDHTVLAQVRQGDVEAITFSSPSSVRRLVDLVGGDIACTRQVPVICAGPVTAASAREAGFLVVGVSDDPGPESMADAVVAVWSRHHRFGRISHHVPSSQVSSAMKRSAV